MKRVIVVLAPGFEEIEALTVVDILRRAGMDVTVAGTIGGIVEGRNGIRVEPDRTMDSVVDGWYDLVVLPGGAVGTENLKKDDRVKRLVERHLRKGAIVSAICAGPTVLASMGLTQGRRLTAHPTVREELKDSVVVDDRVVVDGNIITSQAPGTAMEFAFKLVEVLEGDEKVKEVNRGVLARL